MTLNLLRASAVSSHMSAWHQLHNKYNFVANSIAPPGMKIICHEKPKTGRATWDTHGKVGYYLAPVMSHYRCYRVWITETKSVRVTDTVSWHPVLAYLLSGASLYDDLLAVLSRLLDAVKNIDVIVPGLINQRQPTSSIVSSISEAIEALLSIFETVTVITTTHQGVRRI
jgi:hypothetical protein